MSLSDAMMAAFKDANVGFNVVKNDLLEEYASVSEVKLPFGKLPTVTSLEALRALRGINSVRKSVTPLSVDEFSRRTPVYSGNDIKQVLFQNINKVRELTVSGKKVANGILSGYESTDYDLDYDGFYSVFTCLAWKIVYNKYDRSLSLRMKGNPFCQLDLEYQLVEACRNSSKSGFTDGELMAVLAALVERSEFIPLEFQENVSVRINKKGQKGAYDWSYGVNIKEDETIMKELKSWVESGGYIVPHKKYFVVRNGEVTYLVIAKES